MRTSQAIMDESGVQTGILRPVDYDIAPGVYPDMTEHGVETDEWPELWARVRGADILVVGTPIWLGDKSLSATRRS